MMPNYLEYVCTRFYRSYKSIYAPKVDLGYDFFLLNDKVQF